MRSHGHPVVSEVKRHFAEKEKQLEFLQQIDLEIIRSTRNFRQKLEFLSSQFALERAHADTVAICFPTHDGYFVDLFESALTRAEIEAIIKAILPTNLQPGRVQVGRVPKRIRENTAALFLPLGAADNGLVCVIAALTTGMSSKSSPLTNAEIVQYAGRVLTQLSVLIESEWKTRWAQLQERFIKSFMTSKLDRAEILQHCLAAIRDFLPGWEGPEGANNGVLVQLLTYKEQTRPLTIQAQLEAVGASEAEPIAPSRTSSAQADDAIDRDVGKPVLIEDSVCGLMVQAFVQDPTTRVLNIDPSEDRYRSLYKAFFGQAIPKSEAMVTIVDGGKLLGILNLEHPRSRFFTPSYESAIVEAADRLAPFVKQFNEMFDLERKRQAATLHVMFGFLDRLSKTYSHKINQLTPTIFSQCRALGRVIDANNVEAHQKLDELEKQLDQYDLTTKGFVKGAPYYVSRGPIDIGTVIQNAISEIKGFGHKIDYKFDPPDSLEVYASQFLQEHIFQLLNNSKDAIGERLAANKIKSGVVLVEVSVASVRDHRGHVTKGGERVRIRITDNGTGVDESLLRKIGEYKVTTKGPAGTGHGLPAARDYIVSMGGQFAWDNRRDGQKGFVVEMSLDQFDKNYHAEATLAAE